MDDHPPATLTHVIDDLAHLLPAQGPISIFIHHNTLHAFEDLPFEEAVERAGARFGCEPYLVEARYRDKLASGRILPGDVDALLRLQLGPRGDENVPGVGARLDLWRAVVLHGIPDAAGRELAWILAETDVLAARRDLWAACLDSASRPAARPQADASTPVRHRDCLV
ncbi:MAG TPA: putative inorganic carbon transporter subunit DabA, partial [Vicinamibacterales bacterium]|nr:putative inorganic carbon transporter subunit DabA [Vicinamibacterales bacterium]